MQVRRGLWPTASCLWEKREKRLLHENCVRRSSIYICHYYYYYYFFALVAHFGQCLIYWEVWSFQKATNNIAIAIAIKLSNVQISTTIWSAWKNRTDRYWEIKTEKIDPQLAAPRIWQFIDQLPSQLWHLLGGQTHRKKELAQRSADLSMQMKLKIVMLWSKRPKWDQFQSKQSNVWPAKHRQTWKPLNSSRQLLGDTSKFSGPRDMSIIERQLVTEI